MRHIKYKLLLSLMMTLLYILSACAPAVSVGGQNPSCELTISAAASLKDVLEEIVKAWNEENPSVKLSLNFGSSGSLQQQIEQGADVDIFISAADKQMDTLEDKGFLQDKTRIDLLANKMVLIVPADSSKVSSFGDLRKDEIQGIAIGEPESVPAGQYAKEILSFLGMFEDVKSKLVFGKDVRTVLTWVETANADAGLVYQTDANVSTKIKVICEAKDGSYKPIIYPAAVIKSSKYQSEAKSFLEFLQSDKAGTLFNSYGFTFLPQQ